MNKLKIGILFGGRSAEHQVSLRSAKNVIAAIDTSKYQPILIGIDLTGQWQLYDSTACLLAADDPKKISLSQTGVPVVPAMDCSGKLLAAADGAVITVLDVIFPVLHGPFGEDGAIQGLARMIGLPCVGSGVLGSAVAMDKDIAKRLLQLAGLKIADYQLLRRGDHNETNLLQLEQRFGYPMFVKPANMGSSIGVSKAHDRPTLRAAIATAEQFDKKILIEAAVVGREIECAVLGNDQPRASSCGEIVATQGFYDYDAKYISADDAALHIPAVISAAAAAQIKQTALQAFTVLECRGLARVDVFLTASGEVYVNEINTMPGFTQISMYPQLWQHSGLSYSALIDQLLQLAIADFDPGNTCTAE